MKLVLMALEGLDTKREKLFITLDMCFGEHQKK